MTNFIPRQLLNLTYFAQPRHLRMYRLKNVQEKIVLDFEELYL